MIALLEIVRREVGKRRLYLLGGLLLGLLPLVAPLLPLAGGQPAIEVREATAVTLFWIATLVFSLLLGAALFGRDLAEGRLGFYFSRPLAGWTIVVGRVLGGLIVSLGAALLVLLPTVVLSRRLPPFYTTSQAAAIWLLGAVGLLLGAHYLRTFALARSAWRVLDLIGVVGTLMALRWLSGALLPELAWGALERALLLAATGSIVGLAAALAVQILRGRTAVRLGHRLGSLTLWSWMAVVLAAAGGYAGWVLAAGPEDLEAGRVEAAPAGDWIVLSGTARGRAGYAPAFLYRVADGAHLRLPPGYPELLSLLGRPGVLFSADGSRACWLRAVEPRATGFGLQEWRPFALPSELVCAELAQPEFETRVTPVVVPASRMHNRLLALSADGRRVAHLAGRLLSVEEVEGGRMLAAERLAVESLDGEFFFDRSGERVFIVIRRCVESCRLELKRLDIASRSLEPLLDLDGGAVWQRDPVGHRLLLRQGLGGHEVRSWLVDLETGAARPIAPPSAAPGWIASFLADGRLLLRSGVARVVSGPDGERRSADWQSPGGELWLADRDGAALRRLAHPASHLVLGGQPAPDLLLVAGYDRYPVRNRARGASAYLIDLRGGEERSVGAGLAPVRVAGSGSEPRVGSLGSRLLVHESGDLLLLDPETLDLDLVLEIGSAE